MISTEKKLLRKQLRDAFGGAAQRDAESRLICDALNHWDVFRRAQIIAAYVPLPREADIAPVFTSIWEAGQTLALPRCMEAPHMTFHVVRSLSDLTVGSYGLPEPSPSAPLVDPSTFSLILVPLEGIDPCGHRLGKGCGYYDALLSQAACPAAGIALSWQKCAHVPAEEHDQVLHIFVDAQGIHQL